MDVAYQIGLITGAARDYQSSLMSLQALIHKIEGLLAVIEDTNLSRELEDALFALEYVNAHTFMADYDFEAEGKEAVDRAVNEIIAKTELYILHTQTR
jgi:hypothetical protein